MWDGRCETMKLRESVILILGWRSLSVRTAHRNHCVAWRLPTKHIEMLLCSYQRKWRKKIYEGAAELCATQKLPVYFCSNKFRITKFCKTLVETRQRSPINVKVDVRALMSCAALIENLLEVLRKGGGIFRDGVKNKETGPKYYDFIPHYIGIKSLCTSLSGQKRWKRVLRLLFIERCPGSVTESALGQLLSKKLEKLYKAKVSDFGNKLAFTFLTNSAWTMPCIFGASISHGFQPFSNRWVGCNSHQINTAMKHDVDPVKGIQIDADLRNVRRMVTLFKRRGLNEEITSEMALLQECLTHFWYKAGC